MEPQGKTVTIDFFPESAFRYLDYDAIVCLDVIRAATTLVTAAATGRQVFAAADLAEATRIAADLKDPMLAGADERLPAGTFEIGNSPHAISKRDDHWRPLVLVSSDGTRLLANARGCRAVFVASLRNVSATAEVLASGYNQVALLGACSGGELRCEDQIAAARLATLLGASGFETVSRTTALAVERWSSVHTDLIRLGRSAEHLRHTGQEADLELILSHIDDLDFACEMSGAELHRLQKTSATAGNRVGATVQA